MASIVQNIQLVRSQIKRSAKSYHRSYNDVTLLAVSKKKPAAAIREAYQTGQRAFGENYVQEAIEKMEQLNDLAIEWHFIGSIQSKKSYLIAQHFSWAHTIDRIKVAKLLNQHRSPNQAPMNVCIQVNLDNEMSKSGVLTENCLSLASQVCSLNSLKLRGLMAIPKPLDSFQQQYHSLIRLADLQLNISKQLRISLDTLSMGMSADLEAAIKAGSTMVRVGEAIFGARQ